MADRGVRGAGRRPPHPRGHRRGDRGDAVLRGQGAAARADEPRGEAGAPGDPAGDEDRARAGPDALRRRPAGLAAVGRPGDRGRRGRRPQPALEARLGRDRPRRPAPDRRRAPPLRDRGRLPQAEPEGRAHARGARLVARPGPPDLPDPPRRPGRGSSAVRVHDLGLGHRLARDVPDGQLLPARQRRGARRQRHRAVRDGGRRVHAGRRGGDQGRRRERWPSSSSSCARRRSSRCSPTRRRGETMPKKTTYFYPKLTSGLLLLPVS